MDLRFCIPRRWAPMTYGIIQAAITTAVATTVSLVQSSNGGGGLSAVHWLTCWGYSLIATLPVVIIVSPIIQRMVLALTKPPL